MGTSTSSALLEGAIRPLDIARRKALAQARRLPWLGGALRRKETRICVLASASVALAFAMTSIVPGMLFVAGPVLFGVPHVASDIRYLVLRQRFPKRWIAAICFVSAALLGWRIVELIDPRALPFARVEIGVGFAWMVMGVWMGTATGRHARRWRRAIPATVLIGATAALAILHPSQARALFAYGHNLVALAIWFVLFRRHKLRAVLPLALVALGACVIASGGMNIYVPLDAPFVDRLIGEAHSAAPGWPERTVVTLARSHIFLQAIHYSVWLAWIPQEQVRGDATLTFRMSARAARRDFGACGVTLILLAALAVAAFSLVAVHRTRGVYLSVATFHGYLELACLAFLWGRADITAPTLVLSSKGVLT